MKLLNIGIPPSPTDSTQRQLRTPQEYSKYHYCTMWICIQDTPGIFQNITTIRCPGCPGIFIQDNPGIFQIPLLYHVLVRGDLYCDLCGECFGDMRVVL